MSATIYLDKQHAYFTNLDSLTGKVVLVLHSEASISGIQVKLEGESRTRLPDNSERKRTEAEIHKVRDENRQTLSVPFDFCCRSD